MTTASESHPATLSSDSAMVSAVRYFEHITARVRAGRLPDASMQKPRRLVGCRSKARHTTQAEREQVLSLIGSGLTYREISERTGVTHGMVAWLLFTARHRSPCQP